MFNSLNSIAITGYVVRNPEVRTVANQEVCSVTVATKSSEKVNGKWEEKTEFFTFSIWGDRVENAIKYIRKGSIVSVVGQLRTRSYEKKDGGMAFVLEIKNPTYNIIKKAIENEEETTLSIDEIIDNMN